MADDLKVEKFMTNVERTFLLKEMSYQLSEIERGEFRGRFTENVAGLFSIVLVVLALAGVFASAIAVRNILMLDGFGLLISGLLTAVAIVVLMPAPFRLGSYLAGRFERIFLSRIETWQESFVSKFKEYSAVDSAAYDNLAASSDQDGNISLEKLKHWLKVESLAVELAIRVDKPVSHTVLPVFSDHDHKPQ